MKNVWAKYKWIWLTAINALPFVLDVLFFATGKMDNLFLFLPVFAGLTVLNYLNCSKVIPYLVFQAFMLVCVIVSGCASTHLYYHNISSDFLTPAVGMLFVFLESAIHIITTVVTAIVKAVKNKKSAQKGDC